VRDDMGDWTRRELLGATGVLLGGAWLTAACGGGPDGTIAALPGDARVLGLLAAHERSLLAAARRLAPGPARAARLPARQDAEHLARLEQELRRLRAGRTPGSAPALPAVGPGTAGLLAAKELSLGAYVAATSLLHQRALRALVLGIGAVEAQHAAALRLALGQEPAPSGLARGTRA
jgi:hypothetical protein